MVYLTHYNEFPIYEAAEGGYYYTGQEPDTFFRLNSIKQAKRKINKIKNKDNEWVVMENSCYKKGKYIGDGESWIIEKKFGENSSGKNIYE